MPPLSLYIHFPWCIRKCPYCDFNSHAVKAGIPEQTYVTALLADLEADLELLPEARTIETIFMGGGTPSLFSPEALSALLAGLRERVAISEDCEITLEANPGTFESEKFKAYRQLGINRLSIGVQSFNDSHLQTLGRVHGADEAKAAVAVARNAGFDNLNLDLMFGLPQQSPDEMLHDIQLAVELNPTHLSFYQLTLEPNTYFHKYPPSLPEDDEIFAGQKRCQQWLADHGYRQYEISAYAQDGWQCRHNRNYWKFGDYLGIGAGAHGKISQRLPGKIIRTAKSKKPEHYLAGSDIRSQTLIESSQLSLEFVMNHLRLRNGFSLADYSIATGLPASSLEPALSTCIEHGLLVEQQQRLFCTEKGWDFLDAVLEKFIP